MTYKNGCKTEDGNYMENLIFKDNKEADDFKQHD